MQVTRSVKGYSLIQLMVSIVILTLLIGFGIYGLFSSNKQRQFAKAKQDLLTHDQTVYQVLKKDLDRAIKVKGATRGLRPGISGRTTAPSETDKIDPLNLFIEEYGQFSSSNIAIQFQGNPINGMRLRLNGTASTLSEAGYIHEVARTTDYFFVSNLELGNILQRGGSSDFETPQTEIQGESSIPNSGGEGNSTLTIPLDFNATHFRRSDFSGTLSLRGISEVNYVVENEKLIRKSRRKRSGPWTEKVIAEGVTEFIVRFAFSPTNFDGLQLQPRPPGKEAPVRYLRAATTTPELTWSDIQSVSVEIVSSMAVPAGIRVASIADSGFSIDGSDLKRRSIHWFDPIKFSLRSFEEGFQGRTDCRVTDTTTHCSEQHSDCFRSQDRGAADWKGYGDLDGPYCQCVGSHRTIPTGLDFNDADDRARLNACAAAFNGCEGNQTLLDQHPGLQLACTCLTNRDNYYKTEPSIGSNGYETFEYKEQQLTSLRDGVYSPSSPDPNVPNSNIFRCERYQISGPPYRSCDISAQRFFNAFQSSSAVTSWADRCGCLTYDIDDRGRDTRIPINGGAKNWLRLCGVRGTTACANTRDSSADAYLVEAAGSTVPSQRLSESDAILCQCLSEATESEAPIDADQGGVYSPNWDFRQQRIASLPIPDPSPYSDQDLPNETTTFGSANSRLAQPRVDFPDSQPPLPIANPSSCGVAFCRDDRWGLGCCTQPESSLLPPATWGDPSYSPWYVDWRETHSGYCRWNCIGGEVRTVRERITRSARSNLNPNPNLPPSCGGPTIGSGAGAL